MSEELGEFVEILPPQKRVGEHWYQGTADAVYQNLYSIMRENPRYLIVLSGDHVYKMDYARMLRFHQERGAAVTLAAIEVPIAEASRFGIVAIDEQERVTGFQEKPSDAEPDSRLARLRAGVDGRLHLRHRRARPRARSRRQLSRRRHDFGKDIIPALIHQVPVYAYRFYDENKKASKYWRDIGTLDAYFEANMDLCQVNPEFNLYDPEWPLRTYQPQAPPAKFVFAETGRRCGQALDSVISPGCIVSGSTHLRQRALPERAGPQLLPHRAVHPDARRPRRPARADPPRDHRPRRAHPARRADRLRPRGRSPPPHRHRSRRRRRHDRRRAADRTAQRGSAAVRGGSRPAGRSAE